MSKVLDIKGLRFHKLYVLRFAEIRGREYFWRCRCDCGTERIFRGVHLRSGKTKSCGCVHGVAISNPITYSQLQKVLHYDPGTGYFTWLISSRKYCAGDRAGKFNPSLGYVFIVLNKRIYGAHALAWFYMKQRWPSGEIDHRDTDRVNNKWSNLREATHAQNLANARRSKLNTTGFKGVAPHRGSRFRAYIKGQHLGVFDDAVAAAKVYDAAARKVFGEFARLNFEDS